MARYLLLLLLAGTPGTDLRSQAPCPFGSPARSALALRFGAEIGVVSGLVVDFASGKPTAQAYVQLRLISDTVGLDSIVGRDKHHPWTFYTYRQLAKYRAFTDSAGRFRIEAVPSGQYRITVSTLGQGDIQDTASVGGGGMRLFAVLTRQDGDIACVVPNRRPE